MATITREQAIEYLLERIMARGSARGDYE